MTSQLGVELKAAAFLRLIVVARVEAQLDGRLLTSVEVYSLFSCYGTRTLVVDTGSGRFFRRGISGLKSGSLMNVPPCLHKACFWEYLYTLLYVTMFLYYPLGIEDVVKWPALQ